MKKTICIIVISVLFSYMSMAQTGPAITSWLQNTTATGTYYMQGNSTVIDNGIPYNCQSIEYSDDFVYVTTHGIPAYPTGPFLDGNQSLASDQDAIYQIPLKPVEKSGMKDETNAGNIGIFINGVSLFDYRDGVGWDSDSNSPCGGPANDPCGGGGPPGMGGGGSDWNRDAIPSERDGFDCSKAHPAMGNYHHHQNPSAFKLDLEVVSDICNLYDADGLYAIDTSNHSPLIGFAFDGFPIYGAYGYKNTDGTGGITRIKSSYQLRAITERSSWADGTEVDLGPPVSADYPIGYYREDYEYIDQSGQGDYLDIHNGRFSITPDYPNGTYAYFATVDENWNSTYPYVVGPTFYGEAERRAVDAITEVTTVYSGSDTKNLSLAPISITIVPNPARDIVAIQVNDVVENDLKVDLLDINGKSIASTSIVRGRTIGYINLQTVYDGVYTLRIYNDHTIKVEQLIIAR